MENARSHSHHNHQGHAPEAPKPAQPADMAHGGHAPASSHDAHAAHAGHDMAASAPPAPAAEHAGHGGHGGHGGHEGHDKHAGHDPAAFRDLFWLSLLLTIPVVIFSEMVQDWFNYSIDFPGSGLVAPVLGTFVFVYGGRVFLKGAWDELRYRQPGMMLLISLAIVVAFGASVASEFGLLDLDFWWELAALVTVMLLGHWQEMAALGRTRGALAALAELIPDTAERIEGDEVRTISLAELREGDVVLVRPGSRVPGDGIVVDGRADFDESMLTGESRPVLRETGDRVAAGTVALGSAVRVRMDAIGEGTAIAGIQRLVAQAQASRSRAQALADRAAALLFFAALAVGALTMAIWSVLGDVDEAVVRTVTVLVIACPHALGLAIPLVISISTELSARNGILVKDRLALERMRNIDVVLFDKTGTLTEGSPKVTGLLAFDMNEDSMLRLAAAAEAASEHPLARAIADRATELGSLPPARDFEADAGRGVRATIEGKTVEVGGPRHLRERGLAAPDAASAEIDAWRSRGATVLYVIIDGNVRGALALEDQVRESSRVAIYQLHEAGVSVAMVTGDARNVAESVAAKLGIDEVFAEVLPGDKAQKVAELQRRGLRVAMVGDGVNDAPALARADVGVAIGAGTDVAIESAGVILASDDPRGITGIIRLSRGAYRKMVQNLAWATGYNVLAIPVAAGVFAPFGIVLPPAMAAVAMSLSTIIVAANAQLLKRLDLRPQA